jgi:hypothetical protein
VLAAWLIDLPLSVTPRPIEHEEVAWAGLSELESMRLVDSDRKLLGFLGPLIAR